MMLAQRKFFLVVALLLAFLAMGLPTASSEGASASIFGRVTDITGQPVVGATVTAYGNSGSPESTTTTDDGSYRISGLDAGSSWSEYAIYVAPPEGSELFGRYYSADESNDGRWASPVSLAGGVDRTGIDVVLKSGGRISGRAVRADNSEPIAGATVTVTSYYYWYTAAGKKVTTDSDGNYTVSGLRPGRYRVQIVAPVGSSLISQYYEGSLDYFGASLVSVAVAEATTVADIALTSGTEIEGTMLAPDGSAVRDSRFVIEGETSQGRHVMVTGMAAEDGGFSTALPDGTYEFRSVPGFESAALTVSEIQLQISGGFVVTSNGDDVWTRRTSIETFFAYKSVIGRLTVPSPDSPIPDYSLASMRLEQLNPQFQTWTTWWPQPYGSFRNYTRAIQADGIFGFEVPASASNNSGRFRFVISPPSEQRAAYVDSISPEFEMIGGVVSSVGGVPCADMPCLVDATFQKPNVTGLVRNPLDDSVVAGSRVFFNASTDPDDVYALMNGLNRSVLTNSSGNFGASLADGTWRVTATPPSNLQSQVSEVRREVVVSDGVVTHVDGVPCAQPCNVVLTLKTPNVSGVVRNPVTGEGVPFGSFSVYASDDLGNMLPNLGQKSVSVDSAGRFGVLLGDGTWTAYVGPPWSLQSQLVGIRRIFKVENSLLTTIDGQPCAQPCTLDMTFGLPNLRGRVLDASGAVVTGSWLSVIDLEQLEQGGNVQSHSLNSYSGSFVANLPVGTAAAPKRYQVMMGQPYNNADVVQTTRFLALFAENQEEKGCFLPDSVTTVCPADSDFSLSETVEFVYSAPTVRGVITYDGQSLSSADYTYVQVERLNESNPDNPWSWEGQGASAQNGGKFGLSLSPGVYRISAQVPSRLAALGFASLRQEIRVMSDSVWCTGRAECGPDSSQAFEFPGANFKARVKVDNVQAQHLSTSYRRWTGGPDCSSDPNGVIDDYVWNVDTWSCWSGDSQHLWSQGSDLSIRFEVDGTYQLRTWAQLADGTSASVTSIATLEGGVVTPRLRLLPGADVDTGFFVISPPSPAVQGMLIDASGNPARYGHFSVEKWNDNYWQWVDVSGNIGAAGKFGIRLTSPSSGVDRYRVRFDSYGSSGESLPSVTREFWLDSLGRHSFDSSSPESGIWYPASTSWSVSVPPPNLHGVVRTPEGVGIGSWLNVYRLVEHSDDWGTWSGWEWVTSAGSSWSNSRPGAYAVLLEDEGKYRVDVEQVSSGATTYARFSRFFSVDADGGVGSCPSEGSVECIPEAGSVDLSYPTPSLKGRILDTASLGYGWIQAYRWSGSDWEWVDKYTHVNSGGGYALDLDSGDYRLYVSTYDRSGVARPAFQRFVRIDAEPNPALHTELNSALEPLGGSSSGEFNLSVPTVNVVISVTDGKGLVAQSDPAPASIGSWVSVWGNDFWASGNTDRNGQFSIALPQGTFELDAYPRWGSSTSPTSRLRIVVDEYGDVSSAVYVDQGQEGSSVVSECAKPCTIPARLDRIEPNVSGSVTVGVADGTASGAFVVARRQSDNSVVARTIADTSGAFDLVLGSGDADDIYDLRATIVIGGIPHFARLTVDLSSSSTASDLLIAIEDN